ncbi:MAG: transposase [Euryarchaeota archaeon]|nr:transposase [Euryarchaeota archaeon]
MELEALKQLLLSLDINPDEIEDERYATAFRILFAIIKKQKEEIEFLRAEIQKLRDEINLLKGEQRKPKIRGSKKNENISSEKERQKRQFSKDKESKSKLDKIEIHRTETCEVDRSVLPSDAYSKGYRDVIIQDISIKPVNTKYRIEIFYSPSEQKTYSGKLPGYIKGEFGPGIKSLIITLNHVANVSEPKIHEFLENVGIHISRSTISRILTKDIDIFHQEKAEIFQEGLKSSPYQQIDDTGARVNGVNHYTQILCNPYYTAYFTVRNKNRETILDVLLCGKEKTYCFNEEAFDLMKTFNVSQIWLEKLSSFKNKLFSSEEMRRKLEYVFSPNGYKTTRKKVLEACAIAAYHQSTDIPVLSTLLSDDARQFRQIASHHALCWVHDGRNYKKLRPIVPYFKEKLEAFLDKYWDFYGELCKFREKPDSEVAQKLSEKFDQLFSTVTGYEKLDERISKTKENKKYLLKVLVLPEVPLHNNAAELAARAKVRKRDVSLQTITEEGTKANDTFMTIVQTAKKLGVSAYQYICDRVSNKFEMPSLAQLIREKSSLS